MRTTRATWTVPVPSAEPGLQPATLYDGGAATTCNDNPCDPYCHTFNDAPEAGITSDGSVPTAVCGDGIITYTSEVCDDGNTADGDGCAGDCSAVEPGWVCPSPGLPCTFTAVCGDGVVSGAEECDDGNTDYFDGCSGTCTLEPGWVCPVAGVACVAAACGDGLRVGAEVCDDGNSSSGDGCSSVCQLEEGFHCPNEGQPCQPTTCGDGIPQGTEQCDDGNMNLGDGCTPFCKREPECGLNPDGNSCADSGSCESRCGDGITYGAEECDDGNTKSGDGCSVFCTVEPGYACTLSNVVPPSELTLPIVLRDFRSATISSGPNAGPRHPDFEGAIGDSTGMVTSCLQGEKPEYAYGASNSPDNTIHGESGFDEWYRDVPGVNLTFLQDLVLSSIGSGKYQFYSSAYFPLDGMGFGHQGKYGSGGYHNFGFTSEVRYWFNYAGTEVFDFCGDDDVWVYVNKKLALDIGGVHSEQCRTLDLNTLETSHNLVPGKLYEIIVFQAERHTTQSNYKLTLTGFDGGKATCETDCGDGIVTSDEQCDDGTAANTGGYGKCRPDCTLDAFCGDGVVSGPEQCDDGVNQSIYGNCAPGCMWAPRCGDGVVDGAYGEQCDDGVNDGSGACQPGCVMTLQPFVVTRVFEPSCLPGSAPRWLALGWRSDTPVDSRIDFRVRAFEPDANGECVPLPVSPVCAPGDVAATAAMTPDTQTCLLANPPISSTCPLDLTTVLGGAGAWHGCLQMDAYGIPSATESPTLYEWEALFDCEPSE